MGSENEKKRLDVEVDRLSSLPDDLIHKILSYNDTLDAIGTSTLSSRWRFIWTTMTCLAISSEYFPTLPKFSKFVKHVLSGRDNQREVSSVKLTFRGKVSQVFVKKILEYAFSHNVQQLNITCWVDTDVIEFPLSLFSSQTLKHLILTKQAYHLRVHTSMTLTSTWEVPVLTTLHLNQITLSPNIFNGLISKCVNLKNLTFTRCELVGSDNMDFSVSHPQLSNLTIEKVHWMRLLIVVAPQLKNLIIKGCENSSVGLGIKISAPDLAYLLLQCYDCLKFSADNFHYLEKADISITRPYKEDPQNIVGLFQLLHSVKNLTLNMEILEGIIAKWNATDAKNRMAELQVCLEREKADIVTNIAHIEQGNVPMESRNPLMVDEQKAIDENKLQIEGNMSHINSCWESLSKQIVGNMSHIKSSCKSLSEQIEKGKVKIDSIVRQLHIIRDLLTKLPASERAEMQLCFSSLCAQADIVMSKIRDFMKIQLDENQSRLNVCFHELSTTLQLSS